jgi:hypothetical protein
MGKETKKKILGSETWLTKTGIKNVADALKALTNFLNLTE